MTQMILIGLAGISLGIAGAVLWRRLTASTRKIAAGPEEGDPTGNPSAVQKANLSARISLAVAAILAAAAMTGDIRCVRAPGP